MQNLLRPLSLLLTLCVATLGLQAADSYKIDSVHSGVSFKIRHFINKVPGSFAAFGGTVVLDKEDMTKSSIDATIQAASVNTRNADRDLHLLNEDFFSTEAHPVITFKSTKFEPVGDDKYNIHGELTMLGQTKTVVLDATHLGFATGRNGTQLSGWEATTTINRADWGMSYGMPAVGEEVEVELNIQLHKES